MHARQALAESCTSLGPSPPAHPARVFVAEAGLELTLVAQAYLKLVAV